MNGSTVITMPFSSTRPSLIDVVGNQPSVRVDLADRMPRSARHAQHREPEGLDIGLHAAGDILHLRAGADQADAQAHGLVPDGHQQARLGAGLLADDPHALGVAAPPFLLDADVDAEQIALLQRQVARFAAEGILVMRDRDAGVLARIVAGEILPIDFRVVLVDDQVVGQVVDLARAHARLDMRREILQDLGSNATRGAQHRDFLRSLDGNPVVIDIVAHVPILLFRLNARCDLQADRNLVSSS
ncbi:hypothetical protein QZL74_09680 [Burkholderia gladioli pv. alliicola]